MISLSLCASIFCFAFQEEPVLLEGATVYPAPGKKIEAASVLIRNGIIVAVGRDVKAPPGARRLAGKGLHAYAGFIDAHTHLGLKSLRRSDTERKAEEGPPHDATKDPLFGMAQANRKGLRPHLRAADLVNPVASDMKKWRGAGFTAAVSAIGDEYLSGSSAVLVLGDGPRRNVVLSARWGMHASFRSYGEGYPSTLMGVFAQIRQFFLDAGHYRLLWDRYRRAPLGLRRPPYDPSLEALQPVRDRRQVVVFEADSEEEIHRALALARNLGFSLILSGGGEAYKVDGRLKSVPVLLSLALPQKPKKKEEEKEDRPKRVRQDEARRRKDRKRCALRLHERGISFAFTTRGIEPTDAIKNVAELVGLGLPAEAAHRALTETPARLLGCPQLGTVEPGKIANLTVLTAPLGDKKSKVRYVLTDGAVHEFETKAPPKEKPKIDVSGKWEGSVEGVSFTIRLRQKGSAVDGTLSTRFGEMKLEGTVSGMQLELSGSSPDGDLMIRADVKGGRMTGSYSGSRGEGTFTAKKPEAFHE